MMQLIRDKAHGVVAWTIVAMIAIAFCSWGVSGYFSGRSSPVVAKVDGQKITSDEIDALYNRWLRMMSMQQGFDITKVDSKSMHQQITKGLAEQKAIIGGLESANFYVSDNIVLDNIRKDKHLQDNGKFSKELYQNFLKQANLDEAYFFAMRREALMLQQLQQGFIASSFTLPNEIDRILKIKNQARSFGYAVISATNNQSALKINEDQVKEYYAKNPSSFMEPEKVKLEYVELSIDDLIKKVDVNDQKLREYYNNNLASFTEPEQFHIRHIYFAGADAKTKVDAVYAKLKQGTDFVSLAKTESEDKQTAVKGGDLGWVTKTDDLPPEVFALAKNNDFTPVVQTSYGWHIFQLIERKAAKARDFATVKKVVAARYVRDAAERLFSTEGDELANLAFENKQSLAAASDKLQLPLKSTDYITRQSNSGLAGSAAILKAAFSDEVLKEGNNSDLIRISDDSVVVIRVADKQPEHQQALAEVHDKIVKILQAQALKDKAKLLGEDVLKSIKDGIAPSKAASNKNLSWRLANNIKREDKKVPANIMQQVFLMPRPEAGQAFTSQGAQLPNGDYVVIALNSVTDGVLEKGEKSKESEDKGSIGLQMAILIGRVEYHSLQAALVENAKIEYTGLSDKTLE